MHYKIKFFDYFLSLTTFGRLIDQGFRFGSVCMLGIQLLVFTDQVVVHLLVSGFEVENVGFVRSGSWEFHVGSCAEGTHIKPSLAVGITERRWEKHNTSEQSCLTINLNTVWNQAVTDDYYLCNYHHLYNVSLQHKSSHDQCWASYSKNVIYYSLLKSNSYFLAAVISYIVSSRLTEAVTMYLPHKCY